MSGAVNSLTVVLDANGRWVGNNANFIFIIAASLPVTLELTRVLDSSGIESFQNVQAGLQVARIRRFDQAKISGTVGATVQMFFGYQTVREDSTVFSQQIATIAGTVAVASLPTSAIADTPAVALPNAATTVIVAANLARRRVTITNPSTALGSFFIRTAGGANNLMEVQPGSAVEIDTTAAISGRNDTGAALSALVFEES